jgi:8-oxo-dGTP pyrophosphatase MutT (NUDIX family)
LQHKVGGLVTIKAWRTLNSREVLRDRWISVRADDCVTADGLEISPYYVLDYPDWVHVVALDPLDRVLLIRQYRHGAGIVSVELPAGGVEPSDADILTAGARELAEEAGYGGRVSLVGVNSPNPANHSNRIHTVLARDIAPVGAPQKSPFEEIEPFFVDVDEAVRLATSGEMASAIQVASLLLGLRSAGLLRFSR